MLNLTLVASTVSALVLLQSSAASAEGFEGGFEKLAELPQDWKVQGKISLDAKSTYKGKSSILFERTEKEVDNPTSLTMESFPAREGLWELSVAFKSELYSPDSSFNGAIHLETIDSSGKVLDNFEFALVTKKDDWKEFKKVVDISSGAVSARFKINMNKTHGKFNVAALSAKYLGPSPKANMIFSAIKFSSKSLGNIFYPGEKLSFEVIVECRKDWPSDNREIKCVITDYWGAEYSKPIAVRLGAPEKTGRKTQYKGNLDLSGLKLEDGKYYAIMGFAEFADTEPYQEGSSFVLLPRPITKNYKPQEIPVISNSWNNKEKDHFFLSDRIGARWCGIFSGWGAKAPYEPFAPGIEYCKELDLGAVLGCGPVHAVEYHLGNYKDYNETSMREGAKNLINKYKDYVPLIVRMGNEPHGNAERVKEDVAVYKPTYEGVKQADPKVTVIGTSCGPTEEFFKQGFLDYLDAVDFHTYEDPLHMKKTFKRYDELFAKYGGRKKPVWSTEIGLNSQGMSRLAVARDLIKKFAVFFASGGEMISWFDIFYPDPEAKIVGSNGESFDVFNSKYNFYSPKLTAVAYYNMINGICIKKVVDSKLYGDETEAVLFRDRDGKCMLIIWKEKERKDVFLPLDNVGPVRFLRIDGSSAALDAKGKGLTLTLSEDPLVLFFESKDMKLPEKLGEPSVSLAGDIIPVIKGEGTSLSFKLNGISPDDISLLAPPEWNVKKTSSDTSSANFAVSAPENTMAREGRLVLAMKNAGGELSIPVPISGKISIRMLPEPFKEGAAGMKLLVRNNSSAKEDVSYDISIPEEIEMAGGTFQKSNAKPFNAEISGETKGKFVLEGKSEKEVKVSVSNFNALNIYSAKAHVHDSAGKSISKDRFISGFVGVPKLKVPLKMDLAADESEWQKAPVQNINEERQYYKLAKTAVWKGVDDLSGKLRFLWDDKFLYMRVDVTDDVYVNPKCDGEIWNMDGLQILVDTYRESSEKGGKYEYALAEGTKGPQAWCNYSADSATPTGEVKDIIIKVTKANDGTGSRTYEIAFPWIRLAPFNAVTGANLGMCVILNEDDGPGRGSFMGWFGCAHSKQLDLVGDLILVE